MPFWKEYILMTELACVSYFSKITNIKSKIILLKMYHNIAIDMELTKSEIFTSRQNKLALLFKALAHPARIAIIQQLLKMDSCCCGELVNELGLAQSTISQHLLELKKAGLIKGNVEGVSVCYCIDEKTWNSVKSEVESLFISCSVKNNCY